MIEQPIAHGANDPLSQYFSRMLQIATETLTLQEDMKAVVAEAKEAGLDAAMIKKIATDHAKDAVIDKAFAWKRYEETARACQIELPLGGAS